MYESYPPTNALSFETNYLGFRVPFKGIHCDKLLNDWLPTYPCCRVVLCALEKQCMAPQGVGLACSWGANQFDYYARCHRYDQSVFNILLVNRHQYNRSRYFFPYNIEPPKKKHSSWAGSLWFYDSLLCCLYFFYTAMKFNIVRSHSCTQC